MSKHFSCQNWPGCCPDGSVRHECPALRGVIELPEPSALLALLQDTASAISTVLFTAGVLVALTVLWP